MSGNPEDEGLSEEVRHLHAGLHQDGHLPLEQVLQVPESDVLFHRRVLLHGSFPTILSEGQDVLVIP